MMTAPPPQTSPNGNTVPLPAGKPPSDIQPLAAGSIPTKDSERNELRRDIRGSLQVPFIIATVPVVELSCPDRGS